MEVEKGDPEPGLEGDEIPRLQYYSKKQGDAHQRSTQPEAEEKRCCHYCEVERAKRERYKEIEQVAIRLCLNENVHEVTTERSCC